MVLSVSLERGSGVRTAAGTFVSNSLHSKRRSGPGRLF
jgi:hypothetical protein